MVVIYLPKNGLIDFTSKNAVIDFHFEIIHSNQKYEDKIMKIVFLLLCTTFAFNILAVKNETIEGATFNEGFVVDGQTVFEDSSIKNSTIGPITVHRGIYAINTQEKGVTYTGPISIGGAVIQNYEMDYQDYEAIFQEYKKQQSVFENAAPENKEIENNRLKELRTKLTQARKRYFAQ